MLKYEMIQKCTVYAKVLRGSKFNLLHEILTQNCQ